MQVCCSTSQIKCKVRSAEVSEELICRILQTQSLSVILCLTQAEVIVWGNEVSVDNALTYKVNLPT